MFKKFGISRRSVVAATLSAIALVILAFCFRVAYQDIQLVHNNGVVESITLPLNRSSVGGPAIYSISGQMHIGLLAPKSFRIIPDDRVLEIKVNGETVSLDGFSDEELGSWGTGFVIDLAENLKTGRNTFTIIYSDLGAPGLMGMRLDNHGQYWWVLLGLSVLVLLSPVMQTLRAHFQVSKVHVALYGLIVTGCVIRVVNIFLYNPVYHIGSDARRHWESGVDVLRVDLMTMTDPIMYQLFMSWMAKLTLQMPLLVGFYTSLLSLVTPWIWYRFLREAQVGKTLALVGWALFALLPSWIAIYSYFMQETLLLPLLGAALWATWRAKRKATVAAFCLMVFLWILAGLTRGIAIPLAAVCCTWLWFLQDEKIRKAAYSLMLLVLILGPLTYRSYQTVNQFAPHGMGHVAALYGMSGKREILLHTQKGSARWTHIFGSPSTGTQPFKPFNDWSTAREGRFVVNVNFDNAKEDWKSTYESMDFGLKEYLWITKENLIFLFFANSWPDNNLDRRVDQVNSLMRFIWVPGAFAVIVALVWMRKRLRKEWMLPSLLLMWFIVQGLLPISVNEGRYRKPFEGLLLVQCLVLIAIARRREEDVELAITDQTVVKQEVEHGR